MNSLTISHKLGLFLVTPILAVCFFSVQLLEDKYQDLTIQEKISSTVELSDIYTELVHSLQKERALSTKKLMTSSLTYDSTALFEIRHRTDKIIVKINEVTDQVRQFNASYFPKFEAITKKLLNLEDIRRDIDLANNSTYFSYYSLLNIQLINSISTLYSIGNYFGYSLFTLAYINALWLEEFSHQEHITVLDIFENKKLDSLQYKKLLNIISRQTGAINYFYNIAPLAYGDILQQVLSGDAQKNIVLYRDFLTYQAQKNNLLISLYEVIGYGGLIHNFKNHLLRENPENSIKAKQKANIARQLIEHFINTHERSLKSEKFLGDALATIELYDSHIERITMMKNNHHRIIEIDEVIIVNDQPFFNALKWLHFDKSFFDEELWSKESEKKIARINSLGNTIKSALHKKIEQSIQQIETSVYQLIGLIIAVLFFSFFIGLKLKNRLVNEIEYIASVMRQSLQTKEEKYFEINGCDEIAQMMQAFNELSKQRTENKKNLTLASKVFFYAHEGICITDSRGKVVNINPAFSKITGYSKAEIILDNAERFKFDRQSTENNEQIWEKIISDDYWKGEILGKTKSGAQLVENVTISAVKNERREVSHYIGMFVDITESKRILKRLEEMAYHDSLTKLPNRALLDERFKLTLAYSKRKKHRLAVCYIDLDRFKPVNDTYGHDIGDLVLLEFSERLKGSTREQDTVARVGGDEFVLLLNSAKEGGESEKVINRIIESINQPFIIKGHHIDIGFSIGVVFYPDHGDNLQLLLKLADQAMYQAKYSPNHQYKYYKPT